MDDEQSLLNRILAFQTIRHYTRCKLKEGGVSIGYNTLEFYKDPFLPPKITGYVFTGHPSDQHKIRMTNLINRFNTCSEHIRTLRVQLGSDAVDTDVALKDDCKLHEPIQYPFQSWYDQGA